MRGGASCLIGPRDYKTRFPLTWAYLNECKDRLEDRGNGNLGAEWYGYVYKKNHTRFEQPKLVVPSLAQSACFAADLAGNHYFVGSGGGGGGGCGIVLTPGTGLTLQSLLGLLNSPVSTFFLRHISTAFRGGYFALNRQYIERLPIASVSGEQDAVVALLVDYLLWFHSVFSEHGPGRPPRDALMVGYFEQVLNGLVYELYFPDEVHERGLRPFDFVQQAALPELESIPESQRLTRLREVFETIYDLNHPVRGTLHTLRSMETVRIIEGRR
jgi:hypothetical protein